MAVNRTPVLKRCRSLGLEPTVLGYDKKSKRNLIRARRNEKAERMPGMTGPNLMIMLESRLDNVIFRLGLARTRKEARQIVDHKHVTVNGKCINIPSYLIKAGDVIEIKEKCKDSQRYKDIADATAGRLVPEWLEYDAEALRGTVKELPTREMIDVPVDEVQIVELYSK